LGFCTYSLQAQPRIFSKKLDTGFKICDSLRKPDVVIIHSSYCPTLPDSFQLECVLDLYRKYKVSAHYIIDRQGFIYNLVDEKDISYHGGKGFLPDGDNRINTRSIGIELINTKTSVYTDEQYYSLDSLLFSIKNKYSIKYILGHSDIAPARKTDPWNFDWERLKK
jgi:N-acetyl-anhydromuramyl-L-alanine amidase AmpD